MRSLRLSVRLALAAVFGAVAALGSLENADVIAIAVVPLAVVVGLGCGWAAVGAAAAGFVPIALMLDAGYEPPVGASGVDATEPSADILFALPVYLLLIGIGAAVRHQRHRRRPHSVAES
jgi:lysylphosphatidylglycerol synthetase-like protein (DUF2156 family)